MCRSDHEPGADTGPATRLLALLGELGQVEADQLPQPQASALLRSLLEADNMLQALLARHSDSFDSYSLSVGDGQRSTLGWLRGFGHMSIRRAKAILSRGPAAA